MKVIFRRNSRSNTNRCVCSHSNDIVKQVFSVQKDLRLAVGLSEDVAQPLSVIGASNELFKRAVAEGYGERDMASVYRTLNHSPLEHS